MNTSIDICKNHLCEITVTGKELDNNSYSQELSIGVGSFRYIDTVTINVLYKVNSDNEETLKSMQISQHLQETENGEIHNVPDKTQFKLDEDGLYRLVHIILPTREWFDLVSEEFGVNNIPYEYIYVYDNLKVYKYTEDGLIQVPFSDVFDRESEEILSEESTISLLCNETFTICNTKRCYTKIATKLLNKYCPLDCNLDAFKDLIYKRDLLWMVINVVTYLLELGSFLEAQRIIEQFTRCNNFCKEELKGKGGVSCGCDTSNEKFGHF